jgi:transcriptional regulator with XRE-family HTH domain
LRENRGDEAALFGPHLRSLRQERGLTQAELAKRCGTMVPVISNLERGATVPTLTTLRHLAAALDCTICELVEVLEDIKPGERRRAKKKRD